MEGKKANLFIVGAMKAGTTSFAELLSQHPDIFFSPIKEPHYFVDLLPKQFLETSRYFSLEDYFQNKYPAPLHAAQVFKEEHYQQLFSKATFQKYRAEASTSYLHAPEAADRIYNYNPEAKIIILTRQPLNRAFSNYNMDLALGREKRAFQTVMADELALYKNGTLPWYSYINIGCYEKPIQTYNQLFENVLVLSFEDLIKQTASEMEKVSDFLEIAPFSNPILEKANPGRRMKFQRVFYYLRKWGLKDWLSRFLGVRLKGRILKGVSREVKAEVDLPAGLLKELEEIWR